MNDDTGELVEKANGNKIRKQSDSSAMDETSVVDSSHADSHKSNGGFCVNVEPSSSTAFNNLNGSGSSMNNLNSHNVSNGYSAKLGDNCDHRNGRYTSRYRHMYASSSSDDDDEHCVYTYKGAQVGSDLQESFLCLGLNVPSSGARDSCSSPDMDYLEMDFDPGPSNGQDSDSDNNISYIGGSLSNERITAESPAASTIELAQPLRDVYLPCDENVNCYPQQSPVQNNEASASASVNNADHETPCCSKSLALEDAELPTNDAANVTINSYNSDDCIEYSSEDDIPCDRLSLADVEVCPRELSEDSDKEDNIFIPDAFQRGVGENRRDKVGDDAYDISLVYPSLEDSLECFDELLPVDPSYSISAIANVIKLLRLSDSLPIDLEVLENLLQRKQIPKNVSLVEYLFMRAVQNANENDLASFSSNVFQKKLHSRFFSTYPKTDVNLLEWLNIWMRRGAVPVVTRNIQERGTLSAKNINRHAWKHNVVYKLESSYLYLSNPSEKISESLLHSQLSQAPLIFVKRTSVVKRWTSKVDLRALMRANHNRWYNENVLGQVATIIREDDIGSKNTQYVRIPSNCNCGITLFVPSENSTLCREVDEALELPFICC